MDEIDVDELLRDLLGLNANDDEDEALLAVLEFIVEEFDEDETSSKFDIGVDINRWREASSRVFEEHFRMPKNVFQKLVVAVGHVLEEDEKQRMIRTPLDVSVMMCLWILMTQDTFRSTALHFNTTKGVVFYHYIRICAAICKMVGDYIKWPDAHERLHISQSFEEQTGYLGCVGAIDVVMSYITAPYVQPQRYVNRHHTYSILTQAVCDHRKLYRDVYVGEAGSVGDLVTFERSPLRLNLYRRAHMLSEGEHLIGDQAYPLSNQIQIPYPEVNATDRQRLHNRKLSSARSIVERSFELLKEKFQRLRRFRSYNIVIACHHIMACFILHNFIILEGEAQDTDEHADDNPDELPPVTDAMVLESSHIGTAKREYITLMLWQHNNHDGDGDDVSEDEDDL